MYLDRSKTIVENRVVQGKAQIEKIQKSETFNLYNQIKSRMAAEQALLQGLYQEPTILNLNLKELTLITPHEIKLMTLDMQNVDNKYQLLITGRAKSSQPPPEIILAEFIARLENSPFYKNIVLKKHIKQSEGNRFLIDFQLEMDAVI
jgi:hypothetical protein